MPFSTIAIYHQVQGWGESTMVITTDMLPTVAADFIGATGYFPKMGGAGSSLSALKATP